MRRWPRSWHGDGLFFGRAPACRPPEIARNDLREAPTHNSGGPWPRPAARRPPKREEYAKMDGRVKKDRKFGPSTLQGPPFWPLTLGPPTVRGPYPSGTPLFLATFSGLGPPPFRVPLGPPPFGAPTLRGPDFSCHFFWFGAPTLRGPPRAPHPSGPLPFRDTTFSCYFFWFGPHPSGSPSGPHPSGPQPFGNTTFLGLGQTPFGPCQNLDECVFETAIG